MRFNEGLGISIADLFGGKVQDEDSDSTLKAYKIEYLGYLVLSSQPNHSTRSLRSQRGKKAQIAALVCSDPLEGFDRWTLDLIQEFTAKKGLGDSIGRETVRVILREHDLKPWLQKSWCVRT